MVPFSLSIWYHISNQYGTIFYRNMVPYSFRVSPLLKMDKANMPFQNNPFSIAKRLWLFCMLGIKPEGYAPEHNVLGNTQNTQKKGLHVRFQHYEHKEMRCSFRNTRAAPTKSQRICEACKGLHVRRKPLFQFRSLRSLH